MTKCYILAGETGEYGDNCTWNVRVFSSKEVAEAFANNLNDFLKKAGCHYESSTKEFKNAMKSVGQDKFDEWEYREFVAKSLRDLDSKASVDYTGAHYTIEAVDFI